MLSRLLQRVAPLNNTKIMRKKAIVAVILTFCLLAATGILYVASSFIAYWQRNSPTLERSLLESGWKKEYNSHQSIAGIFSVPSYVETVGVNYAKEFGKVACTLSISYTATEPNPFTVNETCERDVTFFGGSEG